MIAAALAAAGALALAAPSGQPLVWLYAGGTVTPAAGAGDARPVGSLQKPWVLKAWAETHADPSAPLPRVVCAGGASCWMRAGHGALGLRRATAVSCNAYFRRLAGETPERARRDALAAAGFDVPSPLDADAAIGLVAGPPVTVTPRALLEAYATLLTTPWVVRDEARRELLDGMRDAAEAGTAGAVPMRGLLAKTGTVPAADAALAVSGWALAFDAGGSSGRLLFLPRGSGSQAAAHLGERYARELPGAARKAAAPPAPPAPVATRPGFSRSFPDEVRVRMLVALGAATITARNLGGAPASRSGSSGQGWIGPGSEAELGPGDRLGASRWELRVAPYGLVRRVRGTLELSAGPRRWLVLATPLPDYVDGVVLGELSPGSPQAEALASAVMRFLAAGARHGAEDVCDLTHCARFVGEGPQVEWLRPDAARVLAPMTATIALSAEAFARAREAAGLAGPRHFTGHCGGQPLSEHAVWGIGSREAADCPRHGSDPAAWSRRLPDAALRRALGDVRELAAAERRGVRVTRVTLADGAERSIPYDELHALLARDLGWDALPSPPDRYARDGDGWRAEGRGRGHRVGLCLSD